MKVRRPEAWLALFARLACAAAAATAGAAAVTGFATAWPAAAAAHAPKVAGLVPSARPAGFPPPPEPDRATWVRLGRPDRLIIVRAMSIDAVQDGILVAHTPWGGSTVTISSLAGALGGVGWISTPSQGTAVLAAALLVASGADLQVGPDVRRLLLVGGTTPASASWIRCEHASLTIGEVTLSSLRAGSDAGVPPVPVTWAGRPYLYAAAGGTLDLFGSTVTDLGARWRPQSAGVTWATGSTGSAVGARFEGNEVGLLLNGSVAVRLSDVTVENSVRDGLLLRGDRATTLTGVIARSNGGSGVIISGPGTRHVTGLTATANAGPGVVAVGQAGLVLTGVRTAADLGGGVRLVGCVRCVVNGLAAVADGRTALTISGASHDVRVTGARVNGGQTGIRVTAGTSAVTLRSVYLTGLTRSGVEVAATDVGILSSQVSGSPVGVRVYGPADRVQLSGVTVLGGQDGVTVTGTARAVSLSDVTVIGAADDGVRSASAGLQLSGGRISGGHVGIALLAPAAITGVDIDSVVIGIHVRKGVTVTAVRVDVVAERYGIKACAGASVVLSESVIRAPIALGGAGYIGRDRLTELSLPPVPWLGFAAIVAVLLAITLQAVHQLRHRGAPAPRAARPTTGRHARRLDQGTYNRSLLSTVPVG